MANMVPRAPSGPTQALDTHRHAQGIYEVSVVLVWLARDLNIPQPCIAPIVPSPAGNWPRAGLNLREGRSHSSRTGHDSCPHMVLLPLRTPLFSLWA